MQRYQKSKNSGKKYSIGKLCQQDILL